ncbi:unnamed protein product [Vitrella brassicaformis CCMP3155]|uniref:RxLR effector protein n=1 Tax=Vitrella brassicaformis (strain CCMP3155) TaxID=1169540 RepID=A0A0G4G7I3_VITBC|nr:unnamed protein product [Vitrella brassicaformis CCMP3155]|eukprot:CEM24555.1 unnamed protein product [Vitrella brassicaformis CCMP3155]
MKLLSLSLLVCLLGIALVCADDQKRRAANADAPSAVARRLRGGEAGDTTDEVTSDGGVSDALVTEPAAADDEVAADESTAALTDKDEDEPSGLEAVEESSSPTERRLGPDFWDKLKYYKNKLKQKWYGYKNKKYGGGGYKNKKYGGGGYGRGYGRGYGGGYGGYW